MTDEIFLVYTVVFAVFVFILGTVIGSFLNVVIYRTPRHESLVKGRSHCTTCGKQIKNRDLVPIVSWICLGGKCRNCKSPISPRYTVIEALGGVMYLLAFLRFGFSLEFAFCLVLFPILIVLSFIDVDHMEIPYWCSITIGVLGVISIFIPNNMPWYEHLIGAVIISVPFAILAFLGAMGGGDVQLMAAAGLLLGWAIVPAALVGIITGAAYGVIHKAITKKSEMCFGPFLSIGIAVGMLCGNEIIHWYLGLIG